MVIQGGKYLDEVSLVGTLSLRIFSRFDRNDDHMTFTSLSCVSSRKRCVNFEASDLVSPGLLCAKGG